MLDGFTAGRSYAAMSKFPPQPHVYRIASRQTKKLLAELSGTSALLV